MKKKIRLAKDFTLEKNDNAEDMGLPKDSKVFYSQTENCISKGVLFRIEEGLPSWAAEDVDALVARVRRTINDNQGIVDAKVGVTDKGGYYEYSIVKCRRGSDENPEFGVDYELCAIVNIDGETYRVDAVFMEEGMTGGREASGVFIIEQICGINFLGKPEWFCDPFDSANDKGFLMNRAEREALDGFFPAHPPSGETPKRGIKY